MRYVTIDDVLHVYHILPELIFTNTFNIHTHAILKHRGFEIPRYLPITQFILYWNRVSVWLHHRKMVDSGVSHQLSYQIHYQRHDNCEELDLRIQLFGRNNNNIKPRVTCLTIITFIYKKYISDLNPSPDQNMYHAHTQAWKTPLLADSGWGKHLSVNRNRWFWGPIKHPFFKAKRDYISIILDEVPFLGKQD